MNNVEPKFWRASQVSRRHLHKVGDKNKTEEQLLECKFRAKIQKFSERIFPLALQKVRV